MKQKDPRARFIHDPEGTNEPPDWDANAGGETYKGYDWFIIRVYIQNS